MGSGKWFSASLGKKILSYVLVLFIALSINFSLPRLAPGDPLQFVLGEATYEELTPEQRLRVEQELGLDRSVWEQYADFMTGVFRLDLGSSIKFAKPVTEVLAERLPWTFLLVAPALFLSAVIGVAIGAYAAWNWGKKRDLLSLAGMLTLESIPGFWIGMMFIAVFAVTLGWLPSYGAAPVVHTGGAFSYVLAVMKHMTLPVITIALAGVGSNYLLTRSSMLDTLGQDYITMAEAKGVKKRGLIFKHALRNALLPVYTHITMSLGLLVSGAVIVESVFSYPGIGKLLYESVSARDFPMMQGVFLLITISVIAANLLADLTYPLVDPRARTRKTVEESA